MRVITSAATLVEVVHPVIALTSDPEDLAALCGGRLTVIKI